MYSKTAGINLVSGIVGFSAFAALILFAGIGVSTPKTSASDLGQLASSLMSCGKSPVISASPDAAPVHKSSGLVAAHDAVRDWFPDRTVKQMEFKGGVEKNSDGFKLNRTADSSTTQMFASKSSAVFLEENSNNNFSVIEIMVCSGGDNQ